MCYSGHHLIVSGHFYCWVAGSFKYFSMFLALPTTGWRCWTKLRADLILQVGNEHCKAGAQNLKQTMANCLIFVEMIFMETLHATWMQISLETSKTMCTLVALKM